MNGLHLSPFLCIRNLFEFSFGFEEVIAVFIWLSSFVYMESCNSAFRYQQRVACSNCWAKTLRIVYSGESMHPKLSIVGVTAPSSSSSSPGWLSVLDSSLVSSSWGSRWLPTACWDDHSSYYTELWGHSHLQLAGCQCWILLQLLLHEAQGGNRQLGGMTAGIARKHWCKWQQLLSLNSVFWW